MKPILLVGFHKYDKFMYPHLRIFIDKVSEHTDIDYFHFRERGYFMEEILKYPFSIKGYLKAIKSLLLFLIDTVALYGRRSKYQRIVAIDHFSYSICSIVFKKNGVIFWSHDVISRDFIIYDSAFVKMFMRWCSAALVERKKLIIQSRERLSLLLNSMNLPEDLTIDVFYMPTFLNRSKVIGRALSSAIKPRLLQCGGMGRYRFSDDLLEHYQENSEHYRLCFHGFIHKEIGSRLETCAAQPFVSTRILPPDDIDQMVDFCDIGFVGYRQVDSNFKLLAKASGQLAEFLRVGMPLIVIGENDLGLYVEENGIGVGLKDISELNAALARIVGDYDRFSLNCFKHFDEVYESNKYVPDVINFIMAELRHGSCR